MPELRELLAAPACAGVLAEEWSCADCRLRFDVTDGIPNLRLSAGRRAETGRRFEVGSSAGASPHTQVRRPACAGLSELAGGGGAVIDGVHNATAGTPLRLRRVAAGLSGFRVIPFDPVLRDRKNEPARREAW